MVEFMNKGLVEKYCKNCEKFDECVKKFVDKEGKVWCWRGYLGMCDVIVIGWNDVYLGYGLICEGEMKVDVEKVERVDDEEKKRIVRVLLKEIEKKIGK